MCVFSRKIMKQVITSSDLHFIFFLEFTQRTLMAVLLGMAVVFLIFMSSQQACQVCVYNTPSLLILILVIQPLEFPKCAWCRWAALLCLDEDELDLGSTPLSGLAWAVPPCSGPSPTFECARCGVGYSPMVSLLLFSLPASGLGSFMSFRS
jgi:hypothetical protein